MAQFGVTTAMVSLVLSAFMGGLGLGSWGGGALVRKLHGRASPLRLYALAELLIGISAIAVPYQLAFGRKLVLNAVHDACHLPATIFPPESAHRHHFGSLLRLHGRDVPICHGRDPE